MSVIVFADPPRAGRCLAALAPFYDEPWLARLYAAILRDTLDGLEGVPTDRYLVLTEAVDDEGRDALARHLPVPWTLARAEDVDPDAYNVFARPEAPAAHLEALADAVAREAPVLGASADGEVWLVGARADKLDAECSDIVRLPPAIVVGAPASVEALFDELRRHHERAPRTAQLGMTS